MPLDWTVYLGDTRHLTTLEHGAYLLLIAHYWQHQGLPQDERALAQIAGLDAEQWATSRDTLRRLFKLGDWKHKRIEAELTEAARLSRAGRKGGQASGAARRKKREQPQQDRTIVAQSGRQQQFQFRQSLQNAARKFGPFANSGHRVEFGKSGNEPVLVFFVIGEDDKLTFTGQLVPSCTGKRNRLIIIEDCDAHECLSR